MYSRTTTRAAVISTVLFALAAAGSPALAGHDDPDGPYASQESGSEDYGSDERAGRSPGMDIQVGCTTVDVTSPRKISTVTVYFADGSEEVVEVDERGFSGAFETTIDHALAESRNEMAVDHAEGCEPEPGPSPSETGSDGATGTEDDTQDAGTQDDGAQDGTGTRTAGNSDGDGTSTGARTASMSGDAEVANGSGTSVEPAVATAPSATTSTTSVAAGSSMVTGGNAHVLGMVFHRGLKECPSGPHKGMPYLKLSDCGDSVLGIRLARTGAGTAGFALGGIALIGLGTMLLRFRRSRVAA